MAEEKTMPEEQVSWFRRFKSLIVGTIILLVLLISVLVYQYMGTFLFLTYANQGWFSSQSEWLLNRLPVVLIGEGLVNAHFYDYKYSRPPAYILSKRGQPGIPYILDLAEQVGTDTEKLYVLEHLSRAGATEKDIIKYFTPLLQSQEKQVRFFAVDSLMRINDDEVLAHVLLLLSDSESADITSRIIEGLFSRELAGGYADWDWLRLSIENLDSALVQYKNASILYTNITEQQVDLMLEWSLNLPEHENRLKAIMILGKVIKMNPVKLLESRISNGKNTRNFNIEQLKHFRAIFAKEVTPGYVSE